MDIGVVKEGPGDMLLDFLFELDADLREVRRRLRIGVEGTDAEEKDWECLCRKSPRRRGIVSADGLDEAPQCEQDLVREWEVLIGEESPR